MTTTAAATAIANNQLGNLIRANVGEMNWVEAVDKESGLHEPPKRIEITKDGLRIVTDYIETEENGVKKKQKVVTTYKVITKKVPRVVAERRKWTKFGQSASDGPGPNINTTYRAEEIEMQFLHNRLGESEDLLLDEKRAGGAGATKGAHCRLCKSDEHWSTHCPYKEHFNDGTLTEEADAGGAGADKSGMLKTGQPGRYLPPNMRGGGGVGATGPGGERPHLTGSERPSDDTTVRITNLPEDSDSLDEDLRAMFQSVGRITRSYVARDKQPPNRPKGFAFITFGTRQEAEKAIQSFNGAKFEHLILKVEWTRPSNN